MNVRDLIHELDKHAAVSWVAASGGQETEFTKNGKRYLYMWNTFTKEHAYYCISEDLFLTSKQSHERGL